MSTITTEDPTAIGVLPVDPGTTPPPSEILPPVPGTGEVPPIVTPIIPPSSEYTIGDEDPSAIGVLPIIPGTPTPPPTEILPPPPGEAPPIITLIIPPSGDFIATITGRAFLDSTSDGMYQNDTDVREPLLEGVVVKLMRDGVEVRTTETAEDGTYAFEAVAEGEYQIIAAAPDGTTANGSLTRNVVRSGGQAAFVEFGFQMDTELESTVPDEEGAVGMAELDAADLEAALLVYNSNAAAKQVLDDAAKNQKVAKIKIVLVNGGPHKGHWDAANNTIGIRSDLTVDEAVGILLVEALRAKMHKDKAAFYAEALKGKYGRAEYAKKEEEFGYKIVKQQYDIAKAAVAADEWNTPSHLYKNSVENVWRTFDDYLRTQDTPAPGKGADETHTGSLRKNWDKFFKKAWEKSNPGG